MTTLERIVIRNRLIYLLSGLLDENADHNEILTSLATDADKFIEIISTPVGCHSVSTPIIKRKEEA